MTWGKVDDKLHSSVKWRRATRTARGLWTTALSWCSDQENGGQVPADMLRHLDGTKADAASLVRVGLWETTEDGYVFHDWDDHNPDAATSKATRAAKSKGGQFGNHERWHVKRRVKVDGCEFCESDNRSDTDRGSESGANPPGPDPTRPDSYSSKRDTGTPRNARESEPPEAHPEHEFQNTDAVLQAAGLSRDEAHAFRIDLKAGKARSTDRVINDLYRKGILGPRIAEFRREANLAAEARAKPKPGRETPDDRMQGHVALVQRLAATEHPANVVRLSQITEGA
jgi:hypothetical protein